MLLFVGCGDGSVSGRPPLGDQGVAALCSGAADCNDELYCNGVERCDPTCWGSAWNGPWLPAFPVTSEMTLPWAIAAIADASYRGDADRSSLHG